MPYFQHLDKEIWDLPFGEEGCQPLFAGPKNLRILKKAALRTGYFNLLLAGKGHLTTLGVHVIVIFLELSVAFGAEISLYEGKD